MMTKPLLGLLGILIAAITAELNDVVTSIALVDVRGAFGISYDPGTWIQSLYVSAEIVGMAVSPWQLVTFTLRRWTLFSIALCAVSSALIPFSPNVEAIYALRLLQGLSEGLIIPLLMTTALRALTPKTRLYGLAVYALSSTFTPALATTLAALWTDVVVDWRFAFFQAVPLCTLAGVLVWYGDPQDETHYERFHVLDWRGILLLAVGFGAFSTMLYQGDRLDWFNSPLICVLALISGVAIPLFMLNEWFHPLLLIRFQLLGRRNMAYGVLAVFIFLLIAQSATTVPLQFLQQVQGYRPLQSNLITLEIALAQLALLPAVAFLLDFPRVDVRVVNFIGLALMLTACIGSSSVDYTWNRDQFFFWLVRHVRPGQSVTIHLDAYNIDLDGTVNGIGAASGVSFSPIQPNNATGNFTKIVQRLPVKIDVNPDQPLAQLLRVGLSVETTIHTGLENIVDEQRHSTSRVTEH